MINSRPSVRGQESSLTAISFFCSVSARTARRQRHYSFIPTAFKSYYGNIIPARTIGKDGKSYPHQRQNYKSSRGHSWIFDALRYARHGLSKADKLACAEGVSPREFQAMEKLAAQVGDIVNRWQLTQEVTHAE